MVVYDMLEYLRDAYDKWIASAVLTGVLAPNTVTTTHIVDGTIIAADVNALHKDGIPTTASMRTLGTGSNQAAAGDDPRFAAIASGDKSYVHNQVGLASTWTVVHSLGKFPAVAVVDTGGNEIIPDVHYDSTSQLTLTFATATAGKAYVN
jgi:hypothetical protein